MGMLEMQIDMPYSYLSGYDSRKLDLNATCNSWPLNRVDNTTQNEFHHGGSMLPSPPNHPFASMATMKQIILQHEATFREQVHHLHRLYNKQRELMDEIRNSANRHHLRLDMLQSNPFLSESLVHYAPETSQISSLPWPRNAQNAPVISVAKTGLSNTSFYEEIGLARSMNEQMGGSDRDYELTKSTWKKIGKKVLDLELPAYEYIDSEEEYITPAVPGYDLNVGCEFLQEIEVEPLPKKNEYTVDILRVSSSSWRAKPLVDLNEPVVLDDQEEEEADIEPVSLARHNDISCSDTSGKISSQCKVPSAEQMIQNICIEEDPEDGSNVLDTWTENQEQSTLDEHEADKNSLSCLPGCSDLTVTFRTSVRDAKVEQVPETTSSHLVDQDSEKSLIYGENFDLESLGSNCSTNSYPEGGANCKDMSIPHVPPADTNNCKSSRRKGDSMRTFTIIQALPCANSPMLLGRKFRNAGSAGDKSSCGTKECLKDSKRNKMVSDSKDVKLVPDEESVPKSSRSGVLVAKKRGLELSGSGITSDLNSCLDEIGFFGTPSLSREVDMRASGSGSSLDELVRTAAEAIMTISSSRVHNCVETPQLKHSESPNLDWFARIAASAIDDPTSEFGVALSCEHANYTDKQHHKELDFFEEMTLNLEEIKEQDYCFVKPIFHPEEVVLETSSMASQPRRGGTNRRGRLQQRKNFEKEVLPSLVSLSRHEVTKDLHAIAIGGLIQTTRTSRSAGLRRLSTNEWTEVVTKRRRGRPSNVDRRRRLSSGATPIRIGWGNVTRGRRGLRRTPTVATPFIFGQ